MQNRRAFIKKFSLALAGAPLMRDATRRPRLIGQKRFVSRRPPVASRNFISEAVETAIARVRQLIADPEIAWLFENCYPNTLDTTVRHSTINGQPDTFVITGDIEAMWLRDSSAQVWPYLPLARRDPKLGRLLAGVVRRQTKCILIDPYANAFNYGPTGSEWEKDLTEMKKELHERKYELDSLCYPVRLAHGYWKATGDASIFDADWQAATKLILKTFREQQRFENRGPYRFRRLTMVSHDTAALDGYGNPTKPNGLIHSVFRPSDDACIYPLLIPSNFFAVRALKQLAEIYSTQIKDDATAGQCAALAKEVGEALGKHAVARHPNHGRIYAYEIDGFGNSLMMDDANVPSLLSLPYLDCVSLNDPLYRATRRFILSADNPYFFKGGKAEGVGGPHIGLGMIWPMSIIMRALTSTDDDEIIACLAMLKRTHAGTGLMHESFDKDDPNKFTRKWFAWANTLFGELIIRLSNQRPRILQRTF